MTRLLLTAFSMGLALQAPLVQLATAQTADTTTANTTAAGMENLTAEQFAMMASSSNMFEIASSQLAIEQGASGDVATFAQHMIDDHSAAAAEMKTAAEAEGLFIADQLVPEHEAKLNALAEMQGEEFLAAYIVEQIAAHEQAVALFTAYSESGQQGALRDFAGKTLPTLQEHLVEVEAQSAT